MPSSREISWVAFLFAAVLSTGGISAFQRDQDFSFAILGDRTGGAVEGVYDEAWRELSREHPAFVVNVGDTIQGGNNRTVETEWEEVEAIIAPYRHFRILFTPGNHDVWSAASARAYVQHSRRPLHYGFDYRQVHITVLDNSQTEDLPEKELKFLEEDLIAHKNQPVKFIFSHRPSWLLQAVLGNPAFPLHQLAKRYGVRYVIAGHIHQMLHFEIAGVTYLSMASSGGHLRDDKSYERGWFFQHTQVQLHGNEVKFEIKELQAPYGQGRVTSPSAWGAAGLLR